MTSKSLKLTIATAISCAVMLTALEAGQATAAEVAAETANHVTTEKTAAAIERVMTSIKAAKKPLPAWALDLALRAYDTYKTIRNGEKVEEVQREVLSVLKVVDDIKEQIEAGRELTDREFRLTRELLDAHARRLTDLADRVDRLEPRVDGIEAALKAQHSKAAASALFNRVCKEPQHVWRPSQRACLHVSEAGPRR